MIKGIWFQPTMGYKAIDLKRYSKNSTVGFF